MLQRILSASLNNRGIVIAASALVFVLGARQALQTPIDVLPDLDRPVVSILTEAHGLAPEAVEQLVTWPIEQAVSGSTGVLRVRSTSAAGFSVVQVDFDWGTNILHARQIVAEKLQLAAERLPADAQPHLGPIASIMGQIQVIGVHSDDAAVDATELRRLLERDVQPRLLALPGVAQIIVVGGQPTELQVVVDAERLLHFDVTLQDVASAVRRSNLSVAGTTIELGASGPLVAVHGRVESAEDLGRAVIRAGSDGTRPVLIADVAEVTLGPSAVRIGAAGIDGKEGVMLVVAKQPGIDTLVLTERIDRELAALAPSLPPGVAIDPALFRQADFIERAIDNVLIAVRDGAVLVVLILFAFLLNLRTTGITLLAIPLSVAAAVLVFSAFGLTINTMTLGGLAIAIGTLVDDAIVDVENVYRRLRQNATLAVPRATLPVVLDASTEIRRPVLYGTLLVSVVYLPLFFLGGIEGRLLAPVGLAFLVSVGASLIVAMTITPVLCSYWLGGAFAARGEYGSALARRLQGSVASVVDFSVRHTSMIVGTVAALSLCALVLLANRGSTFLPAFQEGSAQVNVILPPDVSLTVSDAYGRRLEQIVGSVDGVLSVARRTGRAANDEHIMPVNVSEAIVRFDPATTRSREAILGEIRDRIAAEMPGVPTSTEQPLAHLLSHLLSGVNAQVAIKIAGPELPTLRGLAERAEATIATVPGVRDLFTDPQVLVAHCEVRPRREELARHGLTVADVAEAVELALGGEAVSRLQVGRVTWPIVVRLESEQRADPQSIGALRLRALDHTAGDGEALLRIRDVADVVLTRTPNQIQRENAERRIVVQHNVEGRALGDVVADVERALAPLSTDIAAMPGYSMRISGTFEAQQQANRTILWLSIASLIAMLAILQRHFGSWKLSALVLATRPIAFLGAVAAVIITGQELSVATLVGLIALLGVAVRNAILYVDCVFATAESHGGLRSLQVLQEAAMARVVPVLMTALTSAIGVLPLALSGNEPGREILYPVATVILGGLVTNTLLDFLVMPGLLVQRRRREVAVA